MPWLDDSEPANVPARTWKVAIKNAILRRMPGEKLASIFRELAFKHPTSSEEITRVLLSFRARRCGTDDTLLFSYARVLLDCKLITTSHLLLALLETSRFAKRTEPLTPEELSSAGLPTCEERMFNMLTQMLVEGSLKHGLLEAHGLVFALARCMQAVTEYEMGKQLEGGALHSADEFSFGMYEALASLVFTILSNETFRGVVNQSWWKQRRGVLVSEMENFDSHVLQWMQSQLGGRLRALTTIPPFIEIDAKGRSIFTDEQILSGIPELPVVNSRAGLFIWLNASLYALPRTDDLSMLTYLQNRYSGNNQALILDLLVACFDTLTNDLLRRESNEHIEVIRSFVCNKIPLLLNILSGFMELAGTVETCIQMAFMSISMDALPPISAGSNEMRERLKLTRLEFLQACALHGLISENAISAVLQEPPIALPRMMKYTKEGLLTQTASNVSRLEPLLDELSGMSGNSGAIAGCLVDTINNLCVSKDTMSLKTVCNMVIKKLWTFDIVMQYTQPASLLLPLCTVLNEWTHDQEQSEFTPAYEEFAAILLFVLTVVHRYGLERADLGLPNDDNLVLKLLQETAVSRSPSDLSEDQSKQLSKWVEGLYATDEHGEMGGISDEVMRHCPPQAFYQLVPTLFEQSVLACKSGALSMKTFKGGLELLVEPFLLPSLVGGLSWVIKHSWEDHGDADVLLQLLDKLLKPSSNSQETKAMHRAILGIIARPLYQSLQNLSQQQPKKKEPAAYMELLKPYTARQRLMEVDNAELEDWISTPNGGLARRVRNTVQDLVAWVSNVGPTPPPKYTHKVFAIGCQMLGANPMRDAIVAELKDQTRLGSGSIALDICIAMISSPLVVPRSALLALAPGTQQTNTSTPTVRDSVRLSNLDVQKLLNIAAEDAEALVRLGRRVEAQLAVNQIPQLPMAMPMPTQAADQMMADLGLTEDALAVPAANTSLDQMASIDPTGGTEISNADIKAMLDQTMDLANPPMQNMSSDPNALSGDASQDIFGDLNMDLTQQSQMNPADNSMVVGSDGQPRDPEEDIFAGLGGLDMDLGGDDFNFG